MPKHGPKPCCSESECYNVDAIVSVDDRGQMVLPKEMRKAMGIAPGDKLALISRKKDGRICCLLLIKADELAEQVKGVVGPMLDDKKDG